MKAASVARDTALLALRLDRLAPGLVESFDGDPALRRHLAGGPRPRPGPLVADAIRLRRALGFVDLPAERRAFLAGELAALERAARTLAGERVPLAQEIRETYGVAVGFGEPDGYREAHRALDALLPGPGSLAARLQAHREADELAPELRERAIRALVGALRSRMELPAGEEVEIELVEGRPWSGFTQALGGGRSLARFSRDAPQRAGSLVRLVAHETYPGHHVEHLYRAASKDPERRLSLTRSPRALVVEGAAELGLDVLVGPGWGAWAAEVLADVGIVTDGELGEALERAMAPLQRVRLDAALLAAGVGTDAARDHLRRWLLLDGPRADRTLRFLTDPAWAGYTATYVVGLPLVQAWCAGDTSRFRSVLARPLTPAALLAGWAGRSSLDRGKPTTDGVDHAMSGRPFC
jgi:hypothetical protein